MKLEVLCGMIGSGKSTYALRRADEGALVVSHDALTEMLHARYRYEPALRAAYRTMEESLATIALPALRDVVVDRTHLTRESRARWIDWAAGWRRRGWEIRTAAVVFPVEPPEVHARRRFTADPRGRTYDEWLMVATHHAAQAALEPVSADEGFDDVCSPDEAPMITEGGSNG